MITVLRYIDESGCEVVTEWLLSLNDRQARARIEARFFRLATGNFGDCKPLRESVWELRVDWGAGYRVYYAKVGDAIVLLLCGGDKRKQDTDIERAIQHLADFKRRTK
ncbi:MAG: type II toxin-antitoxin system RelE/ParE family toxin [Gallionella sp.]|jgi:putative addiction module killer protein|nr:type II toxin-antitoxin system RelE/ParE family toxin [Gallionella sp.]MCK9354784.1 type II toxin-antitoxin system RelE/ParE family toxin [Gallionella sp.]